MLNRREALGLSVAGVAALATASVVRGDQNESQNERDQRPHFRAKQILGSKVTIDNNQSVGTIDDIVLDQDGNVDYLIVINQDNKLVSIPWDAAQFNAEKRLATVNITPEKYQQVPVYTTNSYPVWSTPAYRTQTYQYFGLTPGQQRRMIRRGGVVIQN